MRKLLESSHYSGSISLFSSWSDYKSDFKELGEARGSREKLTGNLLIMTAAVVITSEEMLVTLMSETLLLLIQCQWSMTIIMLVDAMTNDDDK